MSDYSSEPVLGISLHGPTLDSLALFVELADHIGLAGDTAIGASGLQGGTISIEVPAHTAWIPPIDWDTAEEEQG